MPLRLNHFVIERSCSIIYSSTWSFAETAASESLAELKLILCLTLAELFFHVEGRTKLMQMKFLFRQEHSQTALVRKPAQWRVESAVIFERLSWHLAFKQQISLSTDPVFCLESVKIASKSITLTRPSRATRLFSRAGIACAPDKK